MTRRALVALLFACAALAALPAGAAAEGYAVSTLHFNVTAGPANTHCDVVGDLYTPASATVAHPVPAILTTNGFGGSKDDVRQKLLAGIAASQGYVVLSYSGLGFGGSGCQIELDQRIWDGRAASGLISFLGGSAAATNGTRIHNVILDATGHDGHAYPDDPRVGMVGGSYGGQVQFAAAAVDPRLDTIIPIITWNDLAYSLTPNNTDFTGGVSSGTAGVAKYQWALEFSGIGLAQGVPADLTDPARLAGGCPNFDPRVCPTLLQTLVGAPPPSGVAFLRAASVTSYLDSIQIPTMLIQGEADTLFNLQESVATYRALRGRHVPVKLVWQSWGHSSLDIPRSEINPADPRGAYESRIFLAWADYYLKRTGPKPALDFSFFRDWVPIKADATPAYGTEPDYPVGTQRTFYLSGSSDLVDDRSSVRAGSATLATSAAGLPTNVTEISAISQTVPIVDVPGTFVAYKSAPLPHALDVVGVPSADVRLSAPLAAAANALGDNGQLTLFFKLYDVGPNGSVMLPHRLIAPVRVRDASRTLHVELPGIVHRFAAGHRLELVVAGSDSSYRGALLAQPVTVRTDGGAPGVLRVPVYTPTLPPCVSRRHIRLSLRGSGRRVVRLSVQVKGRRTRVLRGRALRGRMLRVSLHGLPRVPVHIRERVRLTRHGRTRTVTRTLVYHPCSTQRRSRH